MPAPHVERARAVGMLPLRPLRPAALGIQLLRALQRLHRVPLQRARAGVCAGAQRCSVQWRGPLRLLQQVQQVLVRQRAPCAAQDAAPGVYAPAVTMVVALAVALVRLLVVGSPGVEHDARVRVHVPVCEYADCLSLPG